MSKDDLFLVNKVHEYVVEELKSYQYFNFVSMTDAKPDKPTINESKAFAVWSLMKTLYPPATKLNQDQTDRIKNSIVDGSDDKKIDMVYFYKTKDNIAIVQAKFYSKENKVDDEIIEDMKKVCYKLFNNTERFNGANKNLGPKLDLIFQSKKENAPLKIYFYLATTDLLTNKAEDAWTRLTEYVNENNSNNLCICLVKMDAKYLKNNYFKEKFQNDELDNIYQDFIY